MRIHSSITVLTAGNAPLFGGVPAVTEALANGHDNKFDDGVYSLNTMLLYKVYLHR